MEGFSHLFLLSSALTLFTGSLAAFFIGGPLLFKYWYPLQQLCIFLNYVQLPTNLNDPKKYKLRGARNLYIKFQSNISKRKINLGVWHLLPEKYLNLPTLLEAEYDVNQDRKKLDEIFDNALEKGDHPVVLYAHGNAFNRSAEHRVELYKIFQALQCHVIAFDYRGYGDSTQAKLSEIATVEDTLTVYRWILKKLHKHDNQEKYPTPVYIWGHSLGTGISLHSFALLGIEVSLLSKTLNDDLIKLRQPNGIVLEAPFNCMLMELQEHFLGWLHRRTPWFKWVLEGVEKNNLTFKSDQYIKDTGSPVLILHAEDDGVVPYKLGVKLYNSALAARSSNYGEVEFQSFAASLNYGHKNIYKSNIIPNLIGDFVKKYYSYQPSTLLEKEDELKSMYPEERRKVLYCQFISDE